MNFINVSETDKFGNNFFQVVIRGSIFIKFIIIIFIYISYFNMNNYINNSIINKNQNFLGDSTNNSNTIFNDYQKKLNSDENDFSQNSCYPVFQKKNIKVTHLIITRFIIEFLKEFKKTIYTKEYIKNGIRVMKKYLFNSLENQKCKDFLFILLLGNRANISYVRSLFNFKLSFKYRLIRYKNLNLFLKKITKVIDVLITTRIDYDDLIYYDAVNDVRKAIDLNKPILLYGYNKGVYYFESDNKYYDFFRTYNHKGCMSIFVSLITVLKYVNQTLTIYNLRGHTNIRETLLKKYKDFGIKELNYEPAIFEYLDHKFIWVRQKFSGTYKQYKNIQYKLKEINFNLTKFYGK